MNKKSEEDRVPPCMECRFALDFGPRIQVSEVSDFPTRVKHVQGVVPCAKCGYGAERARILENSIASKGALSSFRDIS